MKKLFLLMGLPAFFSFSDPHAGLSAEERKFAADYMRATRDALLKDVNGLSEAQLNFKAEPAKWSVAQCMEHIGVAEAALFAYVQKGLKEPADPSKRSEVKATDTTVLRVVTDRSRKSTAPEFLEPEGKFSSPQEALKSFIENRSKLIEYVMSTNDDLRNHYSNHAVMGRIDDYQALLLIAAHSRRHTLQIEEVMANPNFPKQ
ncbi:MAG TPA: DinB family protein [Puia sp.]|nr:DinB family protein [Puia sp.]